MNDQGEHRNKKEDKAKRNKGFPYRKLRVREEEGAYERIKEKKKN